MHAYKQTKVLSSFKILVDTREQANERAERRYSQFGVPFEKATLTVGDYTYDATLPSGKQIIDYTGGPVIPFCSIERKMDLNELTACFIGKKKEQFKNELERATQAGCKLYLLCENADWTDIFEHKYRSEMNPETLMKYITAYMSRYNLNLIFCKEEESGKLIKVILYRELKEALQKGVFDDF